MKKFLMVMMGCMLASGGGVWASLQDGLVAYWPVDDNLIDVTGNGHDGTAYNGGAGLTYVAGKIGQALRIDGQYGHGVDTGTWSPNVHNGAFSIACWARWKTGAGGQWQGLIGKADAWGSADTPTENNIREYWYLEIGDVTGTNALYMQCPGSGGAWQTGQLLIADQWRYVVGVYHDGIATLYVDGLQAASGGLVLDERDFNNHLVFGCKEHNGANPFSGDLDEIAIWNRALTPEEIIQLYNDGEGKSLSGEKWQAVYVAPADKATDIPLTGTKLEWTTSSEPAPGPIIRYDIYLNTDYNKVSDPNIVFRTQTVGPSVFEFNTGALSDNTTYYWRIDTICDDVNIAYGQVSSFTSMVMTPIITQQPQNVSVGPNGWPVSFTVIATTNDGAISYKWFKKGNATVLSTADTLSFAGVDGTQGSYYCELTNAYTTSPVVSDAADLTIVRPAPAGLAGGMVGYWPLNGSGVDASGNGRHGVVNGNTSFITGKIGPAAALDGQGDFVEIADTAALDLTDAITVATWAKVRNAWRYSWQSIVCKGENSWRLQRDGTNAGVEWALGYWETYGGSFGPTRIDDGRWHLIIGTTDGTTEKLFVDGVLDAQHTRTGTPAVQTNDFGIRIGSNAENTARDFDGWLDETVVWNRALSQTEITSLYNGGQGVTLLQNSWTVSGPDPDGSVWVDPQVNLTLKWQLGLFPPYNADYQVYFGEAGGALAFKGTTKAAEFIINEADMNYDRRYEWRVDVTFEGRTEQGPVWSFETTKLKPVIRSNPTTIVVPEEGTATFIFDVESPSEVTYVWFKQEGNVQVGTGNPLVLTHVEYADEGWYYCEATNASGTTTSAPASLMLEQLLAHWMLDETIAAGDINAVVKDATANHHDGTETGEVQSTAGIINGAMAFDGNGDRITVGTWNPNERSPELTISLWAKWAGLNGQYQGLIAKRDSWGANSMMWQIELNVDSGGLSFAREGSYPPGVGALPIGEWAFVAVTFDGANATIYRDGVAVASGAFSLGAKTDAGITIGSGEPTGGNPFNGALDDVRIYNYAMDAVDVAYLYYVTSQEKVCIQPVPNDLDNDCRVGLNDFALIAAEWLRCNLAPQSACK